MTPPALHAAARAPWLATWRIVWWFHERLRVAHLATEAGRPFCGVCLCTDDTACALEDDAGYLEPCSWVAPGLCSGCA